MNLPFPNRPILLVVPFPLGHPSDIAGRRLAPRLSELIQKPVTVENWPGASGTTGAERMKHMPPDGDTLMIHGVNGLAIAPHVMKLGYDPIRDFSAGHQPYPASHHTSGFDCVCKSQSRKGKRGIFRKRHQRPFSIGPVQSNHWP
jgi:hypothetical protein